MEYLEEAIKQAKDGVKNNEGGPFGAIVVDSNGKIIGRGNNKVLLNNDPTCHAEIVAIRDACQKINNYDLTGCKIYSTSEPCPMCLSAIIWSNIKEVYYATDRHEINDIGFRDNIIYDYFQGHEKDILNIKRIKDLECENLLKEYKNKIY